VERFFSHWEERDFTPFLRSLVGLAKGCSEMAFAPGSSGRDRYLEAVRNLAQEAVGFYREAVRDH
jgi:hypothetical protein